MKADTSTSISSTSRRSASNTATKSAKASDQGPLPGKGPWVRVDDVWYTKDEADEWVIMPGQPKAKGLKRMKSADTTS